MMHVIILQNGFFILQNGIPLRYIGYRICVLGFLLRFFILQNGGRLEANGLELINAVFVQGEPLCAVPPGIVKVADMDEVGLFEIAYRSADRPGRRSGLAACPFHR